MTTTYEGHVRGLGEMNRLCPLWIAGLLLFPRPLGHDERRLSRPSVPGCWRHGCLTHTLEHTMAVSHPHDDPSDIYIYIYIYLHVSACLCMCLYMYMYMYIYWPYIPGSLPARSNVAKGATVCFPKATLAFYSWKPTWAFERC